MRYRSFTAELLKDMRETRRLGAENDLPILASSVAFLSIFSLCPLLILSFVMSQYFLRQINVESAPPEAMNGILNSLLPSIDPSIAVNILSILKQSALTNVFNLVVLVWSIYELFRALHTAFTNISVRGNVRNAVWTHVVSLICFLVVVGSSSAFLIASTTDPEILRRVFRDALGGYQPHEVKFMAGALAMLITMMSISFIYKLMPTQTISWEHALRGALLFMGLFFLGRILYHVYVSYYRFANAETFGPFVTVLMVIVWIYYVSRVFLFSAQYAVYLEEKNRKSRR